MGANIGRLKRSFSAIFARLRMRELLWKRGVASLSSQLALAFRGALSFWTAGELADEELGQAARQIAGTLLRAYSFD